MTTRAMPGCEDRVDARRRSAVVVAGLERHVERLSARSVARCLQRDDLGVVLARGGVEALRRRPSRRRR